jgi:uncharacterized membrane protein YbhN (UPF0104 family)
LSSLRRWGLRLLQIVAAAAIFAILWHAADGREALRLLVNADPVWFAAAIVALTLQTILSALRWRLTASRLGIGISARAAIAEYYLSQVINQSLPGGMVGDAARAVRSRSQAGLVKAGQAVVLERLMGQVVMFLFLAGAFAATWIAPGGLVWPAAVALPVALILAAGFVLPPLLWSATRLPGVLGSWAGVLRDVVHACLLQRGTVERQVVLSIGTATCNLAAFAFCAHAVGATLPLGALLAIVPLVLFTMLVPLSMSGWGLREGAAAALFPIAGATAAEGFATSVAFGIAFIVAVLPGLVPLLFGTRGLPAARAPDLSADPDDDAGVVMPAARLTLPTAFEEPTR